MHLFYLFLAKIDRIIHFLRVVIDIQKNRQRLSQKLTGFLLIKPSDLV